LGRSRLITRCDVAVVGLGAAGSAVLTEFARRGVRVIGIEQFQPGHNRGSSHGRSRIFRLSYFEHPSYVPLLKEALTRWIALDQEEPGPNVFTTTGILEAGRPGSEIIGRTLAASRLHNLDLVEMDAEEIQRQFPAFHLPADWRGHFQSQAGILRPEIAVERNVNRALRDGAHVLCNTRVQRIGNRGPAVEIQLQEGSIRADTVVVTAGAWLEQLVGDIGLRLTISRQVAGWFKPTDRTLFALGRFPIFLLATEDGPFYGFPDFAGHGVKVASHRLGRVLPSAESLQQDANEEDELQIRHAIDRHLPAANGPLVHLETCMYTNTFDGHFIIDRLPDNPRMIIASPCSGHGFKFAPVLGVLLADLAEGKQPVFPLEGFSLE
jgi:sarcosine oxidase